MSQKILKIGLIILIIFAPGIAHPQSILLGDYLELLQQRVGSYLVFPPDALKQGWEGIAKVKFTLTADGRIKEIDIAESSGYPLLDAAAILAIKDASPYPFPKDYPKEEIEVILPVDYQGAKVAPQPVVPEILSPAPQPVVPEALTLEHIPPPAPYKEALTAQPEELAYFLDLAVQNDQPTQVAREDIKLTQLKIIETGRKLFPGVKVSAYTTDGKVYSSDFKEQEAKFEVTQPLYYGGRLVDGFKQSKVELEIGKRNYDRLKTEAIHKTELAYYGLVAARMHLRLKQGLLEEARAITEKIEKLSKEDLLTPLEFNSSRTWFKQIQFQVEALRQELQMAELALKQALNTKEAPRIEAQTLQVKKLPSALNLSTCLEAGLNSRPEMHLSELLVKYSALGRKIKKSEGEGLTVDLVSSLGTYKGHLNAYPMTYYRNWFTGIKVSKPWGGSTFTTSYSSQDNQPQIGTSSPTKYNTTTAEFAILDNLTRVTDKKKADVDLRRSLSDFNETSKKVTSEVQEAFLNYQKALLLLNTAESEIKFRRNETEVTKTRAMVGEASLSSALEALYTLSEAQSKYIQALADYQASLANLKKATGYSLQI